MAEHPHLHPSDMTPEQRREEVTALLARGFLRLRAQGDAKAADDDEISVNRDNALEVIQLSSPYARAV